MIEQVRAICIGKDFISMGDMFIINGGKEVYFRPLGLKRKKYLVLGNMTNLPYEDKELYKPNSGGTGRTIRIFWADLSGSQYVYKIPPRYIALIDHLSSENEQLRIKNNELIEKLYNQNNEDLGRKRIQKDKEFIDSLRPPYFNPFNRGGGDFG